MEELQKRLKSLKNRLDLAAKKNEIAKIKKESESTQFWQKHRKAAKKMKRLADLNEIVEEFQWLNTLAKEEKLTELEEELEGLEEKVYLASPYANSDAILSIHAGQGGTEAMDWTQILYRMYTKYIENQGWSWQEIEKRAGDEAGLKNVTITVKGEYAYGHLQAESGVHRLVRQSPFNADNLRQTSFALVEVLPMIENQKEVKINEEELEWDFYRSSGAGGQNVNKVSTAVRLTHTPTGIVVTSQAQRSQHQNRETALQLLRSKLWEIKKQQEREKEEKLKGKYKKPGWGNQIRSYVLHPYQLVKDLRTEVETSKVDNVLDGDLDQFINAYLKSDQAM